jgi:hypothetical protein
MPRQPSSYSDACVAYLANMTPSAGRRQLLKAMSDIGLSAHVAGATPVAQDAMFLLTMHLNPTWLAEVSIGSA